MDGVSAAQIVRPPVTNPLCEEPNVIQPSETRVVVGIVFAKTTEETREIGEVIHRQRAGVDISLRLVPSVKGDLADRLEHVQQEIEKRGQVLTNALGEAFELSDHDSPLEKRLAALCQFVIWQSGREMWVERAIEADD